MTVEGVAEALVSFSLVASEGAASLAATAFVGWDTLVEMKPGGAGEGLG